MHIGSANGMMKRKWEISQQISRLESMVVEERVVMTLSILWTMINSTSSNLEWRCSEETLLRDFVSSVDLTV